MKKTIIYSAAAALALVSCQKEAIDPEPQPVPETISFKASIEDADTKTTLVDNTKVNWEVGDVITINGKKYSADYAGHTAEFTASEEEAEGTEFHAFYGVEKTGDSASGTLANVQDYDPDGISNLPMYAYSTTQNLTFHNICSVFAVKINENDIETVMKIRLSSEDKAMCGDFTVENNCAILENSDDPSMKVELVCSEAVNPGKEGTIFYIAIPAQTYTNIKVELSSDGENYTKTMTTKVKQITTAVNTIYPMNFLLEGSSVLLDAPYIDEIL